LIGITFAIALGSTFVQIFLKNASRTPPNGRKWAITRDDWIVWTDWAILGGLAFILSILAHNHHQPYVPFPTATLIWGFILLIPCPLVISQFFRAFGAYESGARIKSLFWIAFMNIVGALLLAANVQSGIMVFDWSGV
jgi:hypothetical protein